MRFCIDSKRLLTLGLLTSLAGSAAAQELYPSKGMRFIVGNAPGGSTGAVARMVADAMTAGWGQQVVVDHRPGGNGVIAGDALRRAEQSRARASEVRFSTDRQIPRRGDRGQRVSER
ncbi:MAG: hypothetical protein GEV05_30045 [Betaproteobacteria bacterium]|nr:hypothetical protein [Betaproteobacteria bacterium]